MVFRCKQNSIYRFQGGFEMNNLKIGVKLALGFGFAIIAIVFLGLSGYNSVGKLNTGQDDMYICGKSVAAISDVDSEMRNVRVGLQTLLNEAQKDKVQDKIAEIDTAFETMDKKLAEYETYLNGNVEDTNNFKDFKEKKGYVQSCSFRD